MINFSRDEVDYIAGILLEAPAKHVLRVLVFLENKVKKALEDAERAKEDEKLKKVEDQATVEEK